MVVNFKFEGDIDGVTPRQLEFVSGILENRGFTDGTVTIEAFGKAGDNYMASMKRLTVKKDERIFRMIAKVAVTNDVARMMSGTKEKYLNEHVIYTEILPKFVELEESADIPQEDRLRFAACYGSLFEELNEIILLEDLQETNFVMLDRLKSLTDENVKLVLKNFAKLHSLSFVMRNKEPEKYAALKSKLINTMAIMAAAEPMKMLFAQMEGEIMSVVDDDSHKKILKGSISQLAEQVKKNVAIDSASKYSVIQHGDAWTNNFMFKLDGEKTVECCLIDYQQSAENSPVDDIQRTIFSCTDYETRSKHYHEWIDYYHAQLDKCLANFGLKANFIYPRDRLDADLKRQGKLSFGLTILLTAMMMKESSDAEKLKEAMQNTENQVNMDEFMQQMTALGNTGVARLKDKLEGLIKSFVEYGYL